MFTTREEASPVAKAKASNVIEKAGRVARQALRSPSDVAVGRKVATVVFRDSKAPKDTVSVNTADGVVYLRGTVRRPEQIKTLEAAVSRIPEVRGVKNLLRAATAKAKPAAAAAKRTTAKAKTTGTAAKRTTAKAKPATPAKRTATKASESTAKKRTAASAKRTPARARPSRLGLVGRGLP